MVGSPSSPVSRVVYNGKRNSSPRPPPRSSEIFTPAHEENVRFIYEGTWGTPRGSKKLPRAPLLPFPLLPSGAVSSEEAWFWSWGAGRSEGRKQLEPIRLTPGEGTTVEEGTMVRSGRTRACREVVWPGCVSTCAPMCP